MQSATANSRTCSGRRTNAYASVQPRAGQPGCLTASSMQALLDPHASHTSTHLVIECADLEARRKHGAHERASLGDCLFRVERALRHFSEVPLNRRCDEGRARCRSCHHTQRAGVNAVLARKASFFPNARKLMRCVLVSSSRSPTGLSRNVAFDPPPAPQPPPLSLQPNARPHFSSTGNQWSWDSPTTSMTSSWSKVSFESAMTFLQGTSARSSTSAQSCRDCNGVRHRRHTLAFEAVPQRSRALKR